MKKRIELYAVVAAWLTIVVTIVLGVITDRRTNLHEQTRLYSELTILAASSAANWADYGTGLLDALRDNRTLPEGSISRFMEMANYFEYLAWLIGSGRLRSLRDDAIVHWGPAMRNTYQALFVYYDYDRDRLQSRFPELTKFVERNRNGGSDDA